jgi:hypothetical protein
LNTVKEKLAALIKANGADGLQVVYHNGGFHFFHDAYGYWAANSESAAISAIQMFKRRQAKLAKV